MNPPYRGLLLQIITGNALKTLSPFNIWRFLVSRNHWETMVRNGNPQTRAPTAYHLPAPITRNETATREAVKKGNAAFLKNCPGDIPCHFSSGQTPMKNTSSRRIGPQEKSKKSRSRDTVFPRTSDILGKTVPLTINRTITAIMKLVSRNAV